MKKIFRNMLALSVAAFVFNACEDVPEPYPVPVNGSGETQEVQTLGTADAPLSTAAALDLINALSDNATSEQDAYVKGKVVKIVTTASQFEQYGNINYYISDDGADNNTIYVYAGDGLAGNFFTSVNDIKAGDEVVVFGKLQKYVNNSGKMTPEIAKGNYIVKLTAGESPNTTTIGTIDNPQTVAQALTVINGLDDDGVTSELYYVKGKIKTIKTTAENIAKYKNIDYIITDDGNNELTVFRGKNIDNTDFTEAGQINVGDEVIVLGNLQKYVNPNTSAVVPEIAQGNYIVKLTAGSETPTHSGEAKGTGSLADPFNALAATNAASKLDSKEVSSESYYIKGIISQIKYAFDAEHGTATFSISEDGKTENEFLIYSTLFLGNENWKDGNTQIKVGDEVIVYGQLTNYNGTLETASKKSYLYSLNGKMEDSGNNDNTSTSLNVDFKANGQGDWGIIDTKELGEGINYVWTYDSKYGMKASAYVSGTRFETDSWLISPAINLVNDATLTFSHVQRYGSGSDLHVMVSTSYTSGNIDVAQWSEISIDQWPDGSNWNFITSTGKIPAGNNVHIAFRYTSSTTTAATWEIENLSVK